MIYQNWPFRYQGCVLVVDLNVTPVGLRGIGLEPIAAAECRLKAVASFLLDYKGNPCVGIGKEDNVGGRAS